MTFPHKDYTSELKKSSFINYKGFILCVLGVALNILDLFITIFFNIAFFVPVHWKEVQPQTIHDRTFDWLRLGLIVIYAIQITYFLLALIFPRCLFPLTQEEGRMEDTVDSRRSWSVLKMIPALITLLLGPPLSIFCWFKDDQFKPSVVISSNLTANPNSIGDVAVTIPLKAWIRFRALLFRAMLVRMGTWIFNTVMFNAFFLHNLYSGEQNRSIMARWVQQVLPYRFDENEESDNEQL